MSGYNACQASAPLRTPPDDKTIRAKKREISVRYAWQACQRNGKVSKTRMMTLRRLNELERLYAARQCLVDDDAGREYLEIAAHHIAHLRGEVEKNIVDWSRRWAPWLSVDEAKAMAKRIAADKPRKWNALSLGNELNLTPEERERLNIGTFRPAGWTKKQITKAAKERRKRRDRDRNERTADKEGRIPRSRPGRPRKTTVPMWEKLGMSRPTWYRKGKPSETNILTTSNTVNAGENKCLKAETSSNVPSPDWAVNAHLISADPVAVNDLNLTYMNYHGTAPNAGADFASNSNLLIEPGAGPGHHDNWRSCREHQHDREQQRRL